MNIPKHLEKVRSIANKLDANSPVNYGVMKKPYSSRNSYSNFNILNDIVPEKEFYAVVIPDYVTVTYSCAVFTYYMDQLNRIIESVEYASDAYWGDPERFQFRAMIDSFASTTELSDAKERIVKSTFTIKMNGHIIPDILQKDLNSIKIFLQSMSSILLISLQRLTSSISITLMLTTIDVFVSILELCTCSNLYPFSTKESNNSVKPSLWSFIVLNEYVKLPNSS